MDNLQFDHFIINVINVIKTLGRALPGTGKSWKTDVPNLIIIQFEAPFNPHQSHYVLLEQIDSEKEEVVQT